MVASPVKIGLSDAASEKIGGTGAITVRFCASPDPEVASKESGPVLIEKLPVTSDDTFRIMSQLAPAAIELIEKLALFAPVVAISDDPAPQVVEAAVAAFSTDPA